ncbi:FAD-binding oxidoreductase [bacterium]|nr:FAD-binding oxidoreductase [bacterium]
MNTTTHTTTHTPSDTTASTTAYSTTREDLLDTLRHIVGSQHVLDSKQASERATHFWDSQGLVAKALVRPASSNETAKVLQVCHEAGQTVVTHGGVTGLVDGNRSNEHDIIVSLERQSAIEHIDPTGRTITVQAGAKLQVVQEKAAESGLQFGLDLGARGTCTIGGNVSTNAGGLSVLRYGMTREQVLGLEVVLADGTIISSMNAMMKNNAGYDLKQLFIGSEGTLGIITRVVLRLRAPTPYVETALLAFDNFASITATLQSLDSAFNGTLDAFEVLWQPFYRLNTDPDRSDTVTAPLSRDYPLYAIVERRSADKLDGIDSVFESALARLMEGGVLVDAVIAKSAQEAASIWHIREHIDIALEPDPVFTYDVSLPIATMEDYVSQLTTELETMWPEVTLYVYGHLADGNLHILISPPETNSSTKAAEDTDSAHTSINEATNVEKLHEFCNKLVYTPLQSIGGSISAEHGIGLYKKDYLPLSRNTAELTLMKTLKRTLDPKAILNRGKIFDLDAHLGSE